MSKFRFIAIACSGTGGASTKCLAPNRPRSSPSNATISTLCSGGLAFSRLASSSMVATPEDKGADNWVEASDHAAFHRAGLPFLYFGVNYHTDYHRPSDDFEKVNPAVFQDATELAVGGFRALDQWLDQ